MNELIADPSALTRPMWRWRWFGVAVAWTAAAACAAGVLLYKDRFESNARIYVDTQTVLKPLLAGLAYQPDVDQQVRMLARTLVSRPNVDKLLSMPHIGLQVEPGEYREQAIQKLMQKIKVSPSGAGNLYTVSYQDSDPQRAERLVSSLILLFIDSSSDSKKRDSEDASRFINEQIKQYEEKLTEAENRLKDFKLRNFGLSGVASQDYFSRISALSDEVDRLRTQLVAAEQSRDALRRELQSEAPQLPLEALPHSGSQTPPSDLDQRLDAQRRQLDDLMRRYTEAHPDVLNMRRTIAHLEEQKRLDDDLRAKASASRTGLAPTNPVYQRLRMSLADAEAGVASLRSQLVAQQARLENNRAMASRVPKAEAELAQLNRDYDVIRKNHEQLVARREAASLGVKIDESSGTAEYRLVEPPQVLPRPIFPSRKLLAAASVLFAIVAGIATSIGLARFIPTFNSATTLAQLTGRPVLGAVSLQVFPAMRYSLRLDRVKFAVAVVTFLVANAGWVVWITLQRSA